MIIKRHGRISNSIRFLWLLLALPWMPLTIQYLAGKIYYGGLIRAMGIFAAGLMTLVMLITQLLPDLAEGKVASLVASVKKSFRRCYIRLHASTLPGVCC